MGGRRLGGDEPNANRLDAAILFHLMLKECGIWILWIGMGEEE